MPSINAALVPFIPPGSLFSRFVEDGKLNIRWLTPTDPAQYQILNRPIADMVLRQLILAKTIDSINDSMGFLSTFPFVNQPLVENGSISAQIPIRIFWDMHVSIPSKWGSIRLARIDRLDGANSSSGTGPLYTGILRFIFTGSLRTDGSEATEETALFYVDYEIDSTLTYQIAYIVPASSLTGFSGNIATSEHGTIGGTIVFKTANVSDPDVSQFLDVVPPGSSAKYWLAGTSGADTGADFSRSSLSHGTGLLTTSSYNTITTLESDPLNWVEAFNYPFELAATRVSSDGHVTIPSGLFVEFNITAPAGDAPSGDASYTNYPVWINRIERNGDNLIATFSTYNTTDIAPDSTPVEFATLTLQRNMSGGQIVSIVPKGNLLRADASGTRDATQLALWTQHFGRGHVVLSRKWDTVGGDIDTLFDDVPEISGGIATIVFSQAGTRISSYGISRIPKYIPTKGQSQALTGTHGDPNGSNRFVTETDEGLGDITDFEASGSGVTSHAAISRYGYRGTRVHKIVSLVVDPGKADNSAAFYDTEILPRLRVLYGRNPIFGDEWYNGNRFMKFNGDAWVG